MESEERFSGFIWPNHHTADSSDLDFLKEALAERDWSHSKLSSRFEIEFAEYVGVKHAMMVPSGTFAIHLALVSLGIQNGDEVILPGITWPSVVYAIISTGGVPVTVDIDPDTLCMNPDAVRQSIGPRTFAILATHLFGSQASMSEISALAQEFGLHVVEDAAQALGSAQAGRMCGAWGDIGAFSLNDRKLLACGEGGVIVTDDDFLIRDLRQQQLILPERGENVRSTPGTFKVSEFQAAVALGQLAKLEGRLANMKLSAEILRNFIDKSPNCKIQKIPDGTTSQSFYNFCVLYRGKESIFKIRDDLSLKLNVNIGGPYLPISEITDFESSVRKIEDRSLKNIKKRHDNCLKAYNETCIRIPHSVLLARDDVVERFGEVIYKYFEGLSK